MTDGMCQKWFAKFRTGDFSLDDAPRSDRPVEVDSGQVEILIENNQRYTTREIAHILKISKSSIESHLHQLGYVNCFGVWVPRKLSEKKPFFFFLLAPFKILFIYFLAVLGLRFCARASSSCGKRGPLFIAVRGPLTIAASLVAEHRLQMRRLSSCGSQV